MAATKIIRINLQDRGVPDRLKKLSERVQSVDDNVQSLDATLDKSMRTVAGFAFQMERLAKSFQNVKRQMGAGGPGVARPVASQGGSQLLGQRQRAPKAPPVLGFSDPNAIIAQYGQSAVLGDPHAIRMVNRAKSQQRAHQRAINTVQGVSPQQAMQQALMRTRFVQQGGKMIGMPLGKDLGLLQGMMGSLASGGGGAELMALSGPAITLAATFSVLVGSAKSLHARFNEIAYGQAVGGGTQQVAGVAKRLEERYPGIIDAAKRDLSGDGTAASEAAKAGIMNPVTGPYGDRDYNERARKMVEYVAKAPSFEEARRRAEAMGLPPETANAQRLTDSQKKDMFAPQYFDNYGSSEAAVQRSERLRKFGEDWKRAGMGLGGIGLNILDFILKGNENPTGNRWSPGGNFAPMDEKSKDVEKTLKNIENNTAKTAEAVSQVWGKGNYGGDSRIDSFPDKMPKHALTREAMEQIRFNAT